MKQNIMIILIFIGIMGMVFGLAAEDKAIFLTNGLMVSIILLHDVFHRDITRKHK
jgi:hypothetical protein